MTNQRKTVGAKSDDGTLLPRPSENASVHVVGHSSIRMTAGHLLHSDLPGMRYIEI